MPPSPRTPGGCAAIFCTWHAWITFDFLLIMVAADGVWGGVDRRVEGQPERRMQSDHTTRPRRHNIGGVWSSNATAEYESVPSAAKSRSSSTPAVDLAQRKKRDYGGGGNGTWEASIQNMNGCPRRALDQVRSIRTIRQQTRFIWTDDGHCKGVGAVDAGTCLRHRGVVRCLPSAIIFGTGKGGTAELQSW